jgi:hypothetical protein
LISSADIGPHQLNSAASRRVSFRWILEIRPSVKNNTRSATSWMLALWVMISVVVPSSGQTGHEVIELKHEADMLAPVIRQVAIIKAGQFQVPEEQPAAGRVIEPAHYVE